MQKIKTVLGLMVLLLGVHFILRLVFGLAYYNPGEFSFAQDLRIIYWGARMDFTALFYINIPFFIFYFFLSSLIPQVWAIRVSLILFALINLPFLALNVIDIVYYRYNLRRSTTDIFHVFGDSIHSFGSLFRQYWFVLVGFLVLCVLFVIVTRRLLKREKKITGEKWYFRFIAPVLFLAISFLIARGWESRPIVPPSALLYADADLQPLVNNSTLNILYSVLRSSTTLERKNYFTEAKLDSVYTIRRQYPHAADFQKRNVVVFVLESFSQQFFMPGRDRAVTPFFDSIMHRSIVCTNAYSNGHESVKGLTAILGGIPPFSEEALFISNYSSVPFNGIGTMLKKEGYNTHFFLGAEYDHFNFAKLCRMVGIDQYHSKDDYGDNKKDDGNWGIYDEFFFPYFADVVSKEKQPFFSVLFNISSHPPYAIPPAQQKRFSIPGQRAQLNAISYVDYCFSQLFEKIRKEAWYQNTIFVFVADHTFLFDYDRDKSYQYKALHIPLFIFDPQQPEGRVVARTVQQLDIIPSILDRMNYSKPFMSFGNSFLRDGNMDSTIDGFSIYKGSQGYQLISSGMLTGYDELSDKTIFHYNYVTDSLLKNNQAGSGQPVIQQRTDLIRAILQRHNNSLIDHKLRIEN